MSSNPERLQRLFQLYINDTGNPGELREFWRLWGELEEDDPVKKDLWELWHVVGHENLRGKKDWEDILNRIDKHTTKGNKKLFRIATRKVQPWRAVAAAVAILLVSGGIYFMALNHPAKEFAQTQSLINDIPPGGNKAVLTLANGTRILLDSAHSGQLASQGHSKVVKVGSGLLAYRRQSSGITQQMAVQYNTLSTPRGGQFQLRLPDGTKVWLNAESSIRFPTSFLDPERRVEITGEAYFEVAPDASAPFIVCKGAVEIKVLGTHFDLNAYDDESAVKVTLLQGSVKVLESTTHHSQVIRPGQQAQVDKGGKIKLIKNINVDEVVAWKNNLFWFEDDDIQTVMRQVSRWYNANVIIKGDIPQHFTGSIPRNIMVSGIFEVLQRTGSIHFKIDGKKIIVSP